MLGRGAAQLQSVEASEVAELGLAGEAEAGHVVEPRHRALRAPQPLLQQETPPEHPGDMLQKKMKSSVKLSSPGTSFYF